MEYVNTFNSSNKDSLVGSLFVYYPLEKSNEIFNLYNDMTLIQEGYAYKFNNETEKYDYLEIAKQFSEIRVNNKFWDYRLFQESIDDLLVLEGLYPSQPIYKLALATCYYFLHKFSCALFKLNEALDLLHCNKPGKQFAIEILKETKKNLLLYANILDKCECIIYKQIHFIGCLRDLNYFKWTEILHHNSYYSNIYTPDQYARCNFIYLTNSFSFSRWEDLLETISSSDDMIIFSAHAGNINDVNLLELSLMDCKRKKLSKEKDNWRTEIVKFSSIYNFIRHELKSSALIIVLGCNIKYDNDFENIIYIDISNDIMLSAPFSLGFLLNSIYSSNIKDNFELAKVFTSIFNPKYENIRYISSKYTT